ncbi:uncharacterized protein EI90DRAFT_3070739 [Cantharellus anzutake]|uniref:uncharacterized protein n=1 Tax=Cantharellus anzutake TaxID=1750568 RepID=UPI001907F93C|nr:uncharacterized protein EI90DRAFT_3070739 [Cantharellus anzutake]KAF8326382.1 hypothetical protein EI90DRAFT_3070739 [Cantharellus anzutake]
MASAFNRGCWSTGGWMHVTFASAWVFATLLTALSPFHAPPPKFCLFLRSNIHRVTKTSLNSMPLFGRQPKLRINLGMQGKA